MTAAVPTLPELLAKYLEQKADAPILPVTEVEPHQAAPAWTEPQAVWPEALRTAALLLPAGCSDPLRSAKLPVDPTWAKALGESVTQGAVIFCLGHVPQLLYDVSAILSQGRAALKLPEPRPDAGPAPEMLPARATLEAKLLRAASLRMTGHFAAAEQLLNDLAPQANERYALLLRNETAALLWQRGEVSKALSLWSRDDHPVAHFNLGLAALCQGDVIAAAAHLQQAAAALSENDPWHHLAQLYLTLAAGK